MTKERLALSLMAALGSDKLDADLWFEGFEQCCLPVQCLLISKALSSTTSTIIWSDDRTIAWGLRFQGIFNRPN